MSGVYLDFQRCCDEHRRQLFNWLEKQQIRLVEEHPLGYMRIHFPEQMNSAAILDAVEDIVFEQSKQWGWEHYGRIYRKILSEAHYDEMAANVERRQQNEESRLRSAFRQELETILTERGQLNVSGYLQFAAAKWKRLIQSLIHEEYNQIEEKIEQEEFIQLLQLFVHTQPPLIDIVYLMVDTAGGFQLKDDQGHDLREEYLATIYPEELEDITEADLMMSILVTLLPEQIMLHTELSDIHQQPLVFRLLEEVFGERIIYW